MGDDKCTIGDNIAIKRSRTRASGHTQMRSRSQTCWSLGDPFLCVYNNPLGKMRDEYAVKKSAIKSEGSLSHS